MNKTLIVAQVFISGMMACLMTATMTAINIGSSENFFNLWIHGFAIAWPIAFIFSLFVGPIAFKLSNLVTGANKTQH